MDSIVRWDKIVEYYGLVEREHCKFKASSPKAPKTCDCCPLVATCFTPTKNCDEFSHSIREYGLKFVEKTD